MFADQLPRAPERHAAPSASRFRTDIEGLRGIAVLVVLGYHASGAPVGGFVGVDVFFVISGFLITGILVREVERTGRISVTGFYARRARRILPAALLVLVTTVAVSTVVWFTPRAWSVALDGVASALFVQNWHLIAAGTDYLQATDPASPLQHFWSLAVEEQFYAVWPIVITLAALPLARRLLGKRSVLIVAVIFTVVMMALSAVENVYTPSTTYFDSVSRAWELGLGAVLAMCGPALHRVSTVVHTVSFWCGIALVLTSTILISSADAFPWPWAVVPVVGTVLLLASGDRVGRSGIVLRNRPLRWVGRISYSLYLWHFPIVVVTDAVFGAGWLSMSGAVVVSFVVAAASERWIERPFLAKRGRRWVTSDVRRGRKLVDAALATLMLVVLGTLSIAQVRGPVQLSSPSAFAALFETSPPAATAPGPPISGDSLPDTVQRAVRSAEERPTAATASLLDAASPAGLAPALGPDGCRNGLRDEDIAAPHTCEWGDAHSGRTAVVVGDSVALSWTPAIVRGLGDGWHVIAIGYASCPLGTITPGTLGTHTRSAAQCGKAQQSMLDFVERVRPDLVVTSAAEGYLHTMEVPDGSTAGATWRGSTEDTLRSLAVSARRIVLLEGTPTVDAPASCATRPTGLTKCTGRLDEAMHTKRTAETRATSSVAATGADIRYVPTTGWMCTADGECPTVIDGTLVRPDGTHLTAAMSERLSSVMGAALAGDPRRTGAPTAPPAHRCSIGPADRC